MDHPGDITYIGKTDFRNQMTRFGIKAIDRTKHMYVIGKTGTGKSTFLEGMLVQDIANGAGLAFIDPHGSSAEKLLDFIPEHRIKDVVYLNPADTDFPIAFNPLEDIDPPRRPLIVDGLMTVFKKIWPDAFSGRMEYILNNTMLALMEYPDPTLLSINRMLTDKDFRKRVIANITDPTVKNAWDELSKWDDKRWSEAIGALINKVGQFTTNPTIRNIVGQTHSTFDFRKAMDERKILIINLSKGRIGEQNQPLFGAMLITKIYLAAMSRSDLSADELKYVPPFYFYVDEFQNFANDSFANILAEARKYKLCLTVANQYVNQMTEIVRDAVFGNMGTTIAFRVGPLDSPLLEKVFTPVFTANDLENLQFGQYYITLQIDNMGSRPFSAQALWPLPAEPHNLKDRVIQASRDNYARPRADVEKEITEWFGYNKKPEPDLEKQKNQKEQPVKNQSPEPKKPQINQSKDSQQKQFKKPEPQKERPHNQQKNNVSTKPISQTLSGLIDQLEIVEESDNDDGFIPLGVKSVSVDQVSPVIIPEKETVKEKVVSQQENMAPKKPVNNRLATPETKNNLLSVLQKAQALRKVEQEKSVQNTQKDEPLATTTTLKDVLRTAHVKPENVTPQPEEESIFTKKDLENNSEDQNQSTQSQPIVIHPSHYQPDSQQGNNEQDAGSIFSLPKAQREVPEDILKKLLE